MIKSTTEIRQAFLDFFYKKGHQIVASSSLVPNNDSTLLFTNAGVVQFKNIFLGQEKYDYPRATTCQRCIRAGGKHNDLENVGYTTRHHTFFEMLGNFSFGDYFKKEAIAYAWELLTCEKWFNLAKDRIWVTVYETDIESFQIWANDIGIPHDRIIRIGDNKGSAYSSDNFWKMGDIGPCGPCTEIFYDQGDNIGGGPPGSPEEKGDRYIEIWNIVFMQFNRQFDGKMLPLPKPSVDTGMGLERIAAVLQQVNSNYKIDLFSKLIESISVIIGVDINDQTNNAFCVIADHIRSCAFLIAEDIVPSNEDRGYVLRRIIRRAIRHGKILGIQKTFFYKLVTPLINIMGTNHKDLTNQRIKIKNVIKNEEELFSKTLERGLSRLNEEIINLKGDILDGKTVFRLYDTFGCPIDLIEDVCLTHKLKIDKAGFSAIMAKQRLRARVANKFKADYYHNNVICTNLSTIYKGYNKLDIKTTVQIIFVDGHQVQEIVAGQHAIIVLDTTPFYGESGGQVGDTGLLIGNNIKFNVQDTQKYGKVIGHIGKLIQGKLCINEHLNALVDKTRRIRICRNHSATHLLHSALKYVLGKHVVQKGSLVNDKYLRFDFFHFKAMNLQEIYQVEEIINAQIRRNLEVKTDIMSLDMAKAQGAIALFGEKYSKHVRVLKVGDFSIELCGGTHIKRTGDIGLFLIRSESSIASNIRRIEAVTGNVAIEHINIKAKQLQEIANLLKANSSNLKEKLCGLINRMHVLEEELQQLQELQVFQESIALCNKVIKVKDTKLLVSKLGNIKPKMLYSIIELLKKQLGSVIIVLATVNKGKVLLIAGITKDLINRVKANELIIELAAQIGGKGGGRSDMAQAGSIHSESLNDALASVHYWVNNRL